MERAWILETKISKKVISTKAKNYLRQDAIDVNKRLVCNIEPYAQKNHLTLSWRRPLSYRNQSIDLL